MKPPKIFATKDELPRLKLPLVLQACENIASGSGAYRSVLYLCFAKAHDVQTLFDATQDADIKARWARLWVLAPFITKLSRSPNGRAAIADRLRGDLPALNLLSKFEDQRHPSVKRLFSRMRDELETILKTAISETSDERRLGILRKLLVQVEGPGVAQKKLDTKAMSDKLKALGPAFGSDEE